MTKNIYDNIAEIIPTLDGWCSAEKANDLALAVIKSKSKVTVEIGVWGGRSLIPMALAHKQQDGGLVWGIDPWSPAASVENQNAANAGWWGKVDHAMIKERFLAALQRLKLEDYVRVIQSKSDDVEPPAKIDVLHIDGNHSDQAVKDVERFATRVRRGGFCFLDDIHWEGGGVERARDRLLVLGFQSVFIRDTGAMFQRKLTRKKKG